MIKVLIQDAVGGGSVLLGIERVASITRNENTRVVGKLWSSILQMSLRD